MKYTFETRRTYVTEVTIIADSEEDAWAWVSENGQTISEAELEQMNVVNEESFMHVQEPSDAIKQEVSKLIAEYYNAREDIFKITEDYYDVMGYDIEGWEDYMCDERFNSIDILELAKQVESAKALHTALSGLNYKFS